MFGLGGWIEQHPGDERSAVVVTYAAEEGSSYAVVRLDPGGWHQVLTVTTALSLVEQPLQINFGLSWMQGPPPEQNSGIDGSGWIPAWLDEAVEELRPRWSTAALSSPVHIDANWLADARAMIEGVTQIANNDHFDGIAAALSLRGQLRLLPLTTPMRHLGYFAVIESLLTHAPAPADPADSLARPLLTKLPLLSHRMDCPIPFDDLNPDAKESTLIKGLYEYRSAIAHGNTPTFTGTMTSLRSHEHVGTFLDTTTRRLLRQAVLEPQLITDLKGPPRT